MPSVLPYSSVPMSRLRSQTPSRSCCTACGVRRASESISANVCSVAASVFAPGVLSTMIPASVAASTSIASTPDAGARDDRKVRPGGEQLAVDARLRANDQAVGARERRDELGARAAHLRVDVDARVAQHRQTVFRERLGDHHPLARQAGSKHRA